jgi:DNA-binding MurR/RpiR family transcriptional regulator
VSDRTDASRGIHERIDADYASLTPRERAAADFILEHLDDLAVYSATEIAESSGVSKATVSRLFRRLGFADASEVREQARASRSRGVPVGPHRASGDLARHAAQERANLDRLLDGLRDGRLEAAAATIASAREVVVVGFRNGYPVALHLRQQLAQARPRVRIAPQPGQSVGEELVGLDGRDVVVVAGFRRRPAGFAGMVEALVERSVPVIVLADPSLRSVAPAVTLLVCPVDGVTPFDSYAAAMSLANLLAGAVLAATPESASRARIAQITTVYAALHELE